MKEKIKNIVAKVRKAIKEFRIMLADDLIYEGIRNDREKLSSIWKHRSDKETEQLLDCILKNCPAGHIVLFKKECYWLVGEADNKLIKMMQERPTLPYASVTPGADYSACEIMREKNYRIFAINPRYFEFDKIGDYVKNEVNSWEHWPITEFSYIKL